MPRAHRLRDWLLLACCACGSRDSAPLARDDKPPVNISKCDAATPSSRSIPSSILGFGDLPTAAAATLRDSLPSFVVADTARYPQSLRDSVGRSSDAGYAIVRGDFRNRGTTDYVVTGQDSTGPRTVALLAQPNGCFALAYIPLQAERGDTLKGVPAVILQLDLGDAGTVNTPRVRTVHLGTGLDAIPERWVWVAAKKRFMLDEPNH